MESCCEAFRIKMRSGSAVTASLLVARTRAA
jgi:hypothetical protein